MFFIRFKASKFGICLALLMQMLTFTNSNYSTQNNGLQTSNKYIETNSFDKIDPKATQSQFFLVGTVFGLLSLISLMKGYKKLNDIPVTSTDRILHALRGIMREEDMEEAKKIDKSEGWNYIYGSIISLIISCYCISRA